MVIDATDLVLGRLASFVSKKALLGENIQIVNCEKSVVTGNKKTILEKYKKRAEIGTPKKGPFYPKRPDYFVRRAIRGMLPYKKDKGKNAYKRVMCFIGVPEKLKDKSFTTIKETNVSKMSNIQYTKVENICKSLGWKT